MAYDSIKIELYLSSSWVDVSADVIMSEGIDVQYGNWQHGPLARTAQSGTMSFVLRNSERNSGGVIGYYSVNHANVRDADFTYGCRVRLTVTYASTPYVKFLGKLIQIDPVPGLKRERCTRCIATDWIDELAVFIAQDIDPQYNVLVDAVIQAIIDAMPSDAQPLQTPDLQNGLDEFLYALQDLGDGTSGLSAVNKAVLSEFGYFDMLGDGTPQYRNRQAAALASPAASFDETQLRDIRSVGSINSTYNKVVVAVHPKTVDDTAVVVWSQDGVLQLAQGEQKVLWVVFSQQSSQNTLIGIAAGSGVTPEFGVDWIANRLPDGSGDGYTAAVTINSVTWYATGAKITITNVGGFTAYVTTLQLRAQGVYDLAPQQYRAVSTQVYGERRLDADLPYQGNGALAQDLADFLLSQYESATAHVEEFTISPHSDNEALLAEGVQLEPGDIVTLDESVTGVSSLNVRLMGVKLQINNNMLERVIYSVEPIFSYGTVWILDDATYSVLDSTTQLGSI